ncbi:hypothetical protein CCE12_19105 [Escherichia coli]|nr:hypothetical protein CCE12_19105 [Escherichia coli]OWH10481.1 hypothetical protein CCE10_19010 [Escherichia coli]
MPCFVQGNQQSVNLLHGFIVRPLNRAQALAKIAEIKAKFGLKGATV